jgi:hypothetical protein
MTGDLASALKHASAALEHLRIPYMIGGSVASSVHGIPRSTRAIDIVARITPHQTESFAKALGSDWYADSDQMREAIRLGRSFNIVYMPSSDKIDIFPAVDDFHGMQLERASRIALSFLDIEDQYPVASAEDIVLAKLRWYRDGGSVSERQWMDIGGLLDANPKLDREYLHSWANRLGVEDLLILALAAAESGE